MERSQAGTQGQGVTYLRSRERRDSGGGSGKDSAGDSRKKLNALSVAAPVYY